MRIFKNAIIKSNVWFDNLGEVSRPLCFFNIWIIGSMMCVFSIPNGKYSAHIGLLLWLCIVMFWRGVYIFDSKKKKNDKV